MDIIHRRWGTRSLGRDAGRVPEQRGKQRHSESESGRRKCGRMTIIRFAIEELVGHGNRSGGHLQKRMVQFRSVKTFIKTGAPCSGSIQVVLDQNFVGKTSPCRWPDGEIYMESLGFNLFW